MQCLRLLRHSGAHSGVCDDLEFPMTCFEEIEIAKRLNGILHTYKEHCLRLMIVVCFKRDIQYCVSYVSVAWIWCKIKLGFSN